MQFFSTFGPLGLVRYTFGFKQDPSADFHYILEELNDSMSFEEAYFIEFNIYVYAMQAFTYCIKSFSKIFISAPGQESQLWENIRPSLDRKLIYNKSSGGPN